MLVCVTVATGHIKVVRFVGVGFGVAAVVAAVGANAVHVTAAAYIKVDGVGIGHIKVVRFVEVWFCFFGPR
jgi:hypothetical protein